MIDFDTFQKMSKNVEVLGKLMVDNGFKKLPKVQLMAQSGHLVLRMPSERRAFQNFFVKGEINLK